MKMPRTSLKLFLLVFVCLALTGCTPQAKRDRHLAKAEKYLTAKKFPEAELECLSALRFDSKSLKALSVLQNVYYDQGRILKLIPVLAATEALDANNVSARLKMARIYMALHDVEKARQRARAVLEKDQTNLEAMLILAESATSPEEVQEVQGLIEKWPKTDSANYHLIKAKVHMRKRDLAAAETELQGALKLDGKSLEAQQSLAWIAWARGDFKRADELFKSAAVLAGDRPFERLRWAMLKIRTGELDEARKILESIAEHHPEFLPAQSYLATIAFEQRRFDDCERIVGQIISQDRSLYTPLELQARLKLARGATDEGIKDLERLANVFKSVPQIHYHLATGYLQKRDFPNARLTLEKTISMDSNSVDALVLLAGLDVQSGNHGKAISTLEPLLKQRPAFVRGRMLLAEAYRAQGAFDQATLEYRRLVEMLPKNPQLKVMLGMIYRQQKKTNEARGAFEKALEDSPDYLSAVNQLVELDIGAQNLLGASNRVAQLIARSPHVPEHHFMMAKLHLALKQIEQTEASLMKAIEVQPEFTSAYDALANLYAATRREAQALSKLEELLRKKPGDIRTLMQQAVLLERMRQPQKAFAAYQQILEVNPNYVPALNNAAYLSAESGGDLDKALQMAEKAVQLVKGNAALQDTLGWIHFKRGESAAAAAVLQEAVSNKTDDPDILFHYGMACYAAGEHETAREAFNRALKSERAFSGRQEAQWRLDTLSLDTSKTDAQSISKLEAIQKQQPKDAGVLLLLGESYERLEHVDKAKRAYAQVLQINSNSVPAMLKLARLTVREPSEANKALELTKTAYSLSRTDPKMKYPLAKVAMLAGDHRWASRLFQEAAEATNQPEIAYDLALCQFWMGNSSAAEATARQAVFRGIAFSRSGEAQKFLEVLKLYQSPSAGRRDLPSIEALLKAVPDWPPALLVYARAHEHAGVSNEARRVYENLTAQSPFFVPAAKEFARFLTDVSHEPAKAQSLLEKAMQVAPLDAAAAATYGEALYLNGSFTNAIKALQEGTRASTVNAEVYYYLGLAYDRVGDRQQSKRMLIQALTLQPRHKLAADAKELLDRFDIESRLPVAKPF